MKIVLTGSLGHIGKPLAIALVQKGHDVTVISSNPERKEAIEALGAKAVIGSADQADLLTSVFRGADAVYTMLPPSSYFNPDFDIVAYTDRFAKSYVQAIRQSGVKRVVHLSSIGAHADKGTGLIVLHHKMERALGALSDVGITFMRPTGFYYNLFGNIETIKKMGVIAANYGGEDRALLVSPIDIAAAIAAEIVTPLAAGGRKVLYVSSEELTCDEVAHILGAAIGKPDLKWVMIPSEQMLEGLKAAGMQPAIAAGLVEMYAGVHSGVMYEDYWKHRPAMLGAVKLTDFAKEFAVIFQGKQVN